MTEPCASVAGRPSSYTAWQPWLGHVRGRVALPAWPVACAAMTAKGKAKPVAGCGRRAPISAGAPATRGASAPLGFAVSRAQFSLRPLAARPARPGRPEVGIRARVKWQAARRDRLMRSAVTQHLTTYTYIHADICTRLHGHTSYRQDFPICAHIRYKKCIYTCRYTCICANYIYIYIHICAARVFMCFFLCSGGAQSTARQGFMALQLGPRARAPACHSSGQLLPALCSPALTQVFVQVTGRATVFIACTTGEIQPWLVRGHMLGLSSVHTCIVSFSVWSGTLQTKPVERHAVDFGIPGRLLKSRDVKGPSRGGS